MDRIQDTIRTWSVAIRATVAQDVRVLTLATIQTPDLERTTRTQEAAFTTQTLALETTTQIQIQDITQTLVATSQIATNKRIKLSTYACGNISVPRKLLATIVEMRCKVKVVNGGATTIAKITCAVRRVFS